MPWARLPPEKLEHLSAFGIDLLNDEGEFAWYRGERGRMYVNKSDPKVWFDDVGDAHQAGAIGILQSSIGD
jgi:hypothetical protein